jgi:hypothetical protein
MLSISLLLSAVVSQSVPELTDANLRQFAESVKPSVQEASWMAMPWMTSLGSALPSAMAKDQPVLLWVADGNPLGLTDGIGIQMRNAIWSSPDVRSLASSFTLVAEDRRELLRGKFWEAALFQKAAGKEASPGLFVLSPAGDLIGSSSALDAISIQKLLSVTRQSYAEMAKEKRLSKEKYQPPTDGPKAPEHTQTFRLYVRDLTRKQPMLDWRIKAWNTDTVWIKPTELDDLVPQDDRKGSDCLWPKSVVQRFSQLAFIDSATGFPMTYSVGSVSKSWIGAVVQRATPDTISVRIRGVILSTESGAWGLEPRSEVSEQNRGIDLPVLGYGEWNRRGHRFNSLEIVAIGSRWGGTTNNNRADDLNPNGIGFVLTGPIKPGPSVPPPAFWDRYGW